MKATWISAILSVLLVASVLGGVLNAKPATASLEIIQVPNGSTIQEAINKANDKDTILVAAGTYNENLVINKSVTLIGDGKSNTFIMAKRTEPVIAVKANNVNISGFSIQGGIIGIDLQGFNMSTISNNTIVSNDVQGIYLNASQGNTFTNNTISLNGFEGIFIQTSYDNLISGNVVTNNEYVGIDLLLSNNNRLSNNTVTFHYNAYAQGIWAESSNNTIIDGNIILNNALGIDVDVCDNNTVYGNIISNNYYGIDLDSSNSNTFYHNNFVNNTQQVNTYLSSNKWDNGTHGNYWSDYNERYPAAKKLDNLGIWDTPYVIDEDNQDSYPLISRWSPPVDATAPITTDDYDGLWHNQDFTITLTAEDYSGIKATYYKINDALTINNVSTNGQPFIIKESSTNTLEYWSVDKAGNNETHHILTNIKLDKTAPIGSITINNDDTYATSPSVTLTLTATDATSGVDEMCFSNDNTTYTEWETYTTSKSWTLQEGDSAKTVYVQFKDQAELIFTYSDTIILDTTPPTISILYPTMGAEIRSQSVTVDWNGTDAGLGIDHYELTLDAGSPINVGTQQTYPISGLGDRSHTVTVKAFDKIGRSSEASVTFVVNTSPLGGSDYLEEATLTVILIIAIGIIVYILRVRKKRQPKRELNLPATT